MCTEILSGIWLGDAHGDDCLIMGEVSMFEHVRAQFKERFLVKSASIISLVLRYDRHGTFSQAHNFS